MCWLLQVKLFFADAQTLDATTRLTNVQFTADLHNSSSQAYRNLTASIREEVWATKEHSSVSTKLNDKILLFYSHIRLVALRSTSLCLQTWRPWWTQTRWESKSEASILGAWWSTSPWSSAPVKAKTSAMCPQLCWAPWWTAPSTLWMRTTQS